MDDYTKHFFFVTLLIIKDDTLTQTVFFFFFFASGLGDLGSAPGRVIPKTLKMVLDTSLLNTQRYKVLIKGNVEQSRERSSTLPYTSVY